MNYNIMTYCLKNNVNGYNTVLIYFIQMKLQQQKRLTKETRVSLISPKRNIRPPTTFVKHLGYSSWRSCGIPNARKELKTRQENRSI